MIKTSVQNVVKTVTWPVNVTCLQENVMDGVNNDGNKILVIKVNNVYIQWAFKVSHIQHESPGSHFPLHKWLFMHSYKDRYTTNVKCNLQEHLKDYLDFNNIVYMTSICYMNVLNKDSLCDYTNTFNDRPSSVFRHTIFLHINCFIFIFLTCKYFV